MNRFIQYTALSGPGKPETRQPNATRDGTGQANSGNSKPREWPVRPQLSANDINKILADLYFAYHDLTSPCSSTRS